MNVICEVVVWILLRYFNFKFSVSPNFILISACSNCLLVFETLYQVLELEMYVMLFFIAIFCSCDARVIIKNSVIFVFLIMCFKGL